ncbi:MAG: flagellar biosynthetic protein FliO [Pseudomonadales bacterium]|nr:flagellar biosynthetic protein FliO [Pseudomonadales bacterium]
MHNFLIFILRTVTAVWLGLSSFSLSAADQLRSESAISESVHEQAAVGASDQPVLKSPNTHSALSGAAASDGAATFDIAKAATSQGVSTSQYANLFLGLVAIIGFIFLVAWLLRRVGGVSTSSASAMKIIAGLSLGSRDRVVLLQVGEKQILVGASPGNISLIHAFDEPAIEDENTSSGSDFYRKLQASLNRSNNPNTDQNPDKEGGV